METRFTKDFETFKEWYDYMIRVLVSKGYKVNENFKSWLLSKKELCENSHSTFFDYNLWWRCYYIAKKLQNDEEFMIVFLGKGGKGKSTMLIQMSAVISTSTFCMDQISYDYDGFINGWRLKKKGDSYALDEGALILNAMERGKKSLKLTQLSAIMRQHNLFVGICLVDFKQLQRHFRQGRMNNIIIFKQRGQYLYLKEEPTLDLLEQMEKGNISVKRFEPKFDYFNGTFTKDIPVLNGIDEATYRKHKKANADKFDRELEDLVEPKETPEETVKKNEKYYNIRDVCEKLGVCSDTAIRLITDNKVRGFKVGKKWKIPCDDIDNIINQSKGLSLNSGIITNKVA